MLASEVGVRRGACGPQPGLNRVVEEADPNPQALLEMHVFIALGTPHNDFANR